jgi:hypothetical protein
VYAVLLPDFADGEGFGGAGDEAAAGAGDPILERLELFSCSTSFFHLLTSSDALRAISLFEFARSLPIKTPAFVA